MPNVSDTGVPGRSAPARISNSNSRDNMSNSNSNTFAPIESWPHLIEVATGNAAAHRATGKARGEARRDGATALPLPAWVDESTALDGIGDKCLELPPVAFRHAPTAETRRRIITAATHRQKQAESSSMLAVTGRRSGEKHTARDVAPEDVEPTYSPMEDADVREAVAVTVAALPELLRDTVSRLLAGLGAPEGITGAAWWKRCERAREAFADVYAEKTGSVVPAYWRK